MTELVKVDFDAGEIGRELRKLERRAQNIVSVNEQLSQILHLMVEDKFEEQGPGWPGFAESTLRRRRASRSPKLLQDSGDLINSMMPDHGSDFASVFTNKAYARYHLEGDGVPKRDFFDIDIPQALETMSSILIEEIGRGR